MTVRKRIDRLIVNSPYEEPQAHWLYDRAKRGFTLESGRRRAGYVVATRDSRSFDDPGVFVEIPRVDAVRERVKVWREAGWPGVSATTGELLRLWSDPKEYENRRFFFCQLEAVETLIWLTEAPATARVGIEIPSDGGEFERVCSKMATGAGKTVVMAMVLAWQILNKVERPRDGRFSKSVLIVAPGLTVRNRLAVLEPSRDDNYYEAFRIVPSGMMDRLRRGRVVVRNWQALGWESDEKARGRRGVDKRGAKSDEAWVLGALGDLGRARDLLVINDEAHHAWRVPEGGARRVAAAEIEEATKWVGSLDRLHRARGILRCHDFSATPFSPTGGKTSEESLFDWVVSDFGLNDAIESGLVKTPRVVVRDDAVPDPKTYKSRLYHLYDDPEVKDDLNRRGAKPEEPLPALVLYGYHLLGYDWRETMKEWAASGAPTRPTMITVTNRTETAARVRHAFDTGKVRIAELCEPERTLHIDSTVLKEAEAASEPIVTPDAATGPDGAEVGGPRRSLKANERAEFLRRQVDTVGRPGEPGERIQNVISVRMLSEGWDAKTVTHIMGLRAFASQLLCEQVVGRGLRRTSYEVSPETGLFEPEYVNVFGVPFTFLPHESSDSDDIVPPPPKPKTTVGPDDTRSQFEIRWPNLIRVERVLHPRLTVDPEAVQTLTLSASRTPKIADLAPVVEGKPDLTKVATIDLEGLAREYRYQRIVFESARDVYDDLKPDWAGSREVLLAQLVRLTDRFVRSDRIVIEPRLFAQDDLKRRLMLILNLTKVVRHLTQAVTCQSVLRLEPIFDSEHQIRSTGDMETWHTGRPCGETKKSHINVVTYDSAWEASEAHALDRSPLVAAWAKNDHLGFEISYIHAGAVRKYRPDFLIRLASGAMLVLEVKGREREPDRAKREALREWVEAVNQHGGFGLWKSAVSRQPDDIHDILQEAAGSDTSSKE